jgi:WD40 repeat protein
MIALQGAKEEVDHLYFSLRDDTLVVTLQNSVQLWANVPTGHHPVTIKGERASSVRFVPGTDLMLFAGPRVSFRDGDGGEKARIRFGPPVPEAADAAVSPDGGLLLFAQTAHLDFDRGRLICRALGEPSADLWSVPGVHRFPRRPMFLAGGDRFVAMEGWNGETGFEHGPAWVTRETGTGRVTSESTEQGNGYLTLVQSPDLSLFAGLSGNRLAVYRTADPPAPVATIKNDSRKHFTGAAFHPGGRFLAATSNDHTGKFYDTATCARAGGFDWEVGRLRSVAFSAGGTLAAAGTDKGRIVLWDVDL